MPWNIIYIDKTPDAVMHQRLDEHQIEHYIPTRIIELPTEEGNKFITKEERLLKRLIFVRTDKKLHHLINEVDGLVGQYRDLATNECAIVSDRELESFRAILQSNDISIRILHDPITKFANYQKVRIRGGAFEGAEGYVVRMRQDRKFVVSLGGLAVAVTGIDRTLLEPIGPTTQETDERQPSDNKSGASR